MKSTKRPSPRARSATAATVTSPAGSMNARLRRSMRQTFSSAAFTKCASTLPTRIEVLPAGTTMCTGPLSRPRGQGWARRARADRVADLETLVHDVPSLALEEGRGSGADLGSGLRQAVNFRRSEGLKMGAGRLIAAYAYQVAPRQDAPFDGGAVKRTTKLQNALDSTFDRSKILSAPAVTFEVSTDSRKHPIRDAALAVGFARSPQNTVVEGLAARLASAMDNRSKPSLLMVSVHAMPATSERRVVLWTFPQQEVFNLDFTRGEANLELLDAFNRESNLRKVALLQGPNIKSGMLTARVLDFQASATQRSVADLWIVKFLAAQLQMGEVEGTQLLARALRSAHTKVRDDQRYQDQITAAIAALRVTAVPRWSIDSVAEAYLNGAAANALTGSVRPEERAAFFRVDVQRFDHLVQYKRFTLDNGVVVSAPFVEIGPNGGVEVSEVDGRRRLRAEGEIREEQVRSRV